MAKDKIRVYSTTPNSNTDVDGVGILGTNKLKNADDAFRALMSHLAKMNAGTDPLDDTFALGDPADITKSFRFDAGLITSGQRRVVSVPDANVTLPLRGGAAYETYYTADATHTFLPSTTYFQISGVGGGAPGGSVVMTVSLGRVGGVGGRSGEFGTSYIFAKAALTGGSILIGERGVPQIGAIPLQNGTQSRWADSSRSISFHGASNYGAIGSSTTVNKIRQLSPLLLDYTYKIESSINYGASGFTGISDGAGAGASTPYGVGGPEIASSSGNGSNALGYGSGGSGASVGAFGEPIGTAYSGGYGAPGLIIVREW